MHTKRHEYQSASLAIAPRLRAGFCGAHCCPLRSGSLALAPSRGLALSRALALTLALRPLRHACPNILLSMASQFTAALHRRCHHTTQVALVQRGATLRSRLGALRDMVFVVQRTRAAREAQTLIHRLRGARSCGSDAVARVQRRRLPPHGLCGGRERGCQRGGHLGHAAGAGARRAALGACLRLLPGRRGGRRLRFGASLLLLAQGLQLRVHVLHAVAGQLGTLGERSRRPAAQVVLVQLLAAHGDGVGLLRDAETLIQRARSFRDPEPRVDGQHRLRSATGDVVLLVDGRRPLLHARAHRLRELRRHVHRVRQRHAHPRPHVRQLAVDVQRPRLLRQ
mmetsp:Transcript_13126/g.41904  ORF Transcript_13126/g.41904 Transcript_13126/m.41904 type:complete len:339 (-) Transcript_13126:361-1377(-)